MKTIAERRAELRTSYQRKRAALDREEAILAALPDNLPGPDFIHASNLFDTVGSVVFGDKYSDA